jgi:hypothetical protein
MKYLMSVLVTLIFTVGLFAQDTLRIHAQEKPMYKKGEKTQVQKRQRTNRDDATETLQKSIESSEGEQNQIRWQKGELTKTQSGYMMADEDGDGIPNGQDPDFSGAKIRSGNANGGFVDLDGDGVNDKAMDDDGDGIPNGQDPDYTQPEDGSGNMYRHQNKVMTQNGSGGYGPGDGTGNSGIGPNDGSGFGPGNGTGTGDITDPKGIKKGSGKK